MRVGFGTDIHPLVNGRKFILGGVTIPFDKGPLGHSDGDVLYHAVTDALLGAAGLGDIGRMFPDEDPKWKNADSAAFIKGAVQSLKKAGFKVGNLDATLHAEAPKLIPHFPKMIQNLSELFEISQDRINLKAKRGEGLDAVGRGEAVSAEAVVLWDDLKCP